MDRLKPTILLADREKVIRTLMRIALARQDYQVLEASDGHRALALARRHDGPIDLLLADASLRHSAESLAAERPDMKVRLLRKPFALSALVAEIAGELSEVPLRKPAQSAAAASASKAQNGC